MKTRPVSLPHVLIFFLVFLSTATDLFAQENISIGVIGALSGPKSIYGISHLRGAELAADIINRDGGVNGNKIVLVPVDDRGEMGLVGNLVTRLIYDEKVLAILGSVDSGCTHVISMICVRSQMPHFTCVATDPSITRAGSPWTFRTLSDDERQSEALVKYLTTVRNFRNLSFIAADSRYGKMGAKIFSRRARDSGIEVRGPIWIKQGDSDLEFLGKIRQAIQDKTQAIVIWSLAEDGKRIVAGLKNAGFSGMILGGDGLASPAFFASGAPGVNGGVVTCPYDQENTSLPNTIFKKEFLERFRAAPDSFAAHAFDTVNMIARSLRNGVKSKSELRAAIVSAGPFSGATGKISLDSSGNDTRQVMLALCDGNNLKLLESLH